MPFKQPSGLRLGVRALPRRRIIPSRLEGTTDGVFRGFLMRRIAIINQKGGVGKTTTAVNLAAALAECGQRVCVLDLDPQAHATTHLGIEPDGKSPSMYDVLVNSRPLAEVRRKVDDNLWVAGSDINLAAAEVELAGVVGREVILRDLLLQDEGAFDFVFMDCGPSLGVLTLNALSAANEVFIPLQPHFLALHGMGKLLETTALVAKRINPSLKVTGIVLSLYESSTRLAQEVIARLAGIPRQEPQHQRPVGQGADLRHAHSPQHQAGGVSELRHADLRLFAALQRRRGLRRPGPRGAGRDADRAVGPRRAGRARQGQRAQRRAAGAGGDDVNDDSDRVAQRPEVMRIRRSRRLAANPCEITMSRISIASPQEIVPIDRGRMREAVRAVLAGEGVADAEISLAFVDNPTIHRLNQRYLQHDEPTDVLSFPLRSRTPDAWPANWSSARRSPGPGGGARP